MTNKNFCSIAQQLNELKTMKMYYNMLDFYQQRNENKKHDDKKNHQPTDSDNDNDNQFE